MSGIIPPTGPPPPRPGPAPTLVEVRQRRGPLGRVAKWLFFAFQVAAILLMLGTCAVVTPFLSAEDPEVAMGAGLFGATALMLLWTVWPLGTLVLGIAVLLTRGRKLLIPAPPGTRGA